MNDAIPIGARFVSAGNPRWSAHGEEWHSCIVKDRATGRCFGVLGDVEQQRMVIEALNRADEMLGKL